MNPHNPPFLTAEEERLERIVRYQWQNYNKWQLYDYLTGTVTVAIELDNYSLANDLNLLACITIHFKA